MELSSVASRLSLSSLPEYIFCRASSLLRLLPSSLTTSSSSFLRFSSPVICLQLAYEFHSYHSIPIQQQQQQIKGNNNESFSMNKMEWPIKEAIKISQCANEKEYKRAKQCIETLLGDKVRDKTIGMKTSKRSITTAYKGSNNVMNDSSGNNNSVLRSHPIKELGMQYGLMEYVPFAIQLLNQFQSYTQQQIISSSNLTVNWSRPIYSHLAFYLSVSNPIHSSFSSTSSSSASPATSRNNNNKSNRRLVDKKQFQSLCNVTLNEWNQMESRFEEACDDLLSERKEEKLTKKRKKEEGVMMRKRRKEEEEEEEEKEEEEKKIEQKEQEEREEEEEEEGKEQWSQVLQQVEDKQKDDDTEGVTGVTGELDLQQLLGRNKSIDISLLCSSSSSLVFSTPSRSYTISTCIQTIPATASKSYVARAVSVSQEIVKKTSKQKKNDFTVARRRGAGSGIGSGLR